MRSRDVSAATFDEAIEVARDWIKFSWGLRRERVFAFPPGIDISPSRFRRSTSRLKGYDHLKLRIAETLRLQGQLPPNLTKIATDMREGKRPRFKRQPPLDLIIVIGMAVETASRHLPTYRNEATSRQASAIDAVARATTLCGRMMTYDMVANRYKQYRHLRGE